MIRCIESSSALIDKDFTQYKDIIKSVISSVNSRSDTRYSFRVSIGKSLIKIKWDYLKELGESDKSCKIWFNENPIDDDDMFACTDFNNNRQFELELDAGTDLKYLMTHLCLKMMSIY